MSVTVARPAGRFAVGFDFGTESVRVVIVDIGNGAIVAETEAGYASGVIDDVLPSSGEKLPPDYALQDPCDWMESSAQTCRRALADGKVEPGRVIGVGVAFTSCTMLPTLRDGTPLCVVERFKRDPMAWPKLWKHHGAKRETDRINQIARERKESWLARYGGTIGLEWFFPKVLETLTRSPVAYDAAEVWLEAGDWIVWQWTSGPFPRCTTETLVRSTCQAGYKAMWNKREGFPSRDYFQTVHSKLRDVVSEKMPGEMRSPGTVAGTLTEDAARLLGLRAGTAVSSAIIDAHAGVPGAGVASPSTMVLVLGTSACQMMNSRIEQLAPGIAGVVEDGILPGYFGYETGQASVGDALAWVASRFGATHEQLTKEAEDMGVGAGGVLAIDWLNGCRTPLMDGRVSGALVGLRLGTTGGEIYRAMMEGTAFGLRCIVETLRGSGVPVRRFVATGGLARKSPLLMQIYCDVLGERITVSEGTQSVALGAAILGCLAAGPELSGYRAISQAIHAMARQEHEVMYRPDLEARRRYEKIYTMYRQLTDASGPVVSVMRELRDVGE